MIFRDTRSWESTRFLSSAYPSNRKGTPNMDNPRAGVDWYQVNELFVSVQGEGIWTGVPATFVRLQGCTVGCWFCDSGPRADLPGTRTNGETRNTWGRGGSRISTQDILSQIQTQHVIITGGEPTLWDLDALIDPLLDKGHTIQLETSGLQTLKGNLWPTWITWSPKQNLGYSCPDALARNVDEIKWVVEALHGDKAIGEFALTVMREMYRLDALQRNADVTTVLMPEGCPPSTESIQSAFDVMLAMPPEYASRVRIMDRLQYRFSIR